MGNVEKAKEQLSAYLQEGYNSKIIHSVNEFEECLKTSEWDVIYLDTIYKDKWELQSEVVYL